MAEKVRKLKLEREPGYLYFIDKQGDISRTLMAEVQRKALVKQVRRKLKRKAKRLLSKGLQDEKNNKYVVDWTNACRMWESEGLYKSVSFSQCRFKI